MFEFFSLYGSRRMFNILSSNLASSISNVFMSKKERHIILDPFSCLVKLALLKYLPTGTKISIYENKLYFNEPGNFQGIVRFIYGDGREDLHNLYQPIRKCAKWFWCDSNKEIKYLFQNAVGGIRMLKGAYSSWSTIQHTLDYYILILIQNDMRYFSSYISNGGSAAATAGHPGGSEPYASDGAVSIMKAAIEKDMISSEAETDTDADDNPKTKNFNPISSIVRDSTRKRSYYHSSTSKKCISGGHNSATAEPVDNGDIPSSAAAQLSDIHKYLKALWSEREMMIIINLFHELDTKDDSGEKKYIYDNIMRYCSMKENKLNKHIEDNSHFLN